VAAVEHREREHRADMRMRAEMWRRWNRQCRGWFGRFYVIVGSTTGIAGGYVVFVPILKSQIHHALRVLQKKAARLESSKRAAKI
jgi:hypothetical protein